MKNIWTVAWIATGLAILASPAYASVALPEPMSMSIVAGGVVILAAVRHLRRK